MATVTTYTTKAGPRYEVRYRLPNGQTTRKRGFETKRDANTFLHQTEVSKSTGGFVQTSAGRVTVATLAEAWEKGQATKAAKTRQSNLNAYRHDVAPKWGTTPVGKIKRSAVQAWVSDMIGAETGVATIERALGVLRQILDLGVADGNLVANPAADVSAPKRAHKARGYLGHAQVQELATEAGPRGPQRGAGSPVTARNWNTVRRLGDMLDDPGDLAIVRAIIALADSFGLQVVAEGVETKAAATTLLRHGCHRAQGFLLSRPLPSDQMATLYRKGRVPVRFTSEM